MYNRTGYIGEAYTVDMHGRLQPRVYGATARAEANRLKENGLEASNLEANELEVDRLEIERARADGLATDGLEADGFETGRAEASSLENSPESSVKIQKARLFGADIEADEASGIEEASEIE
jgi:hypothetical protein